MIRFRLAELMADHQFKHGRRITVKEISDATGINRNTLSRMANTRGYSTSTDTLDKLCRFFGCDVGDVARYLDDEPAGGQQDPAADEGSSSAPPLAGADGAAARLEEMLPRGSTVARRRRKVGPG